eukprot:1970464-Pyramimonas_sp.AAC.1
MLILLPLPPLLLSLPLALCRRRRPPPSPPSGRLIVSIPRAGGVPTASRRRAEGHGRHGSERRAVRLRPWAGGSSRRPQ